MQEEPKLSLDEVSLADVGDTAQNAPDEASEKADAALEKVLLRGPGVASPVGEAGTRADARTVSGGLRRAALREEPAL
jgi:hypothetical protein